MEKLPPVMSDKDWAQIYGATPVRVGRDLAEGGAVSGIVWAFPHMTGVVTTPEGVFEPALNLRSAAFSEAKCACADGRRGKFCAHALALYFAFWKNHFEAKEAAIAASRAAAKPVAPASSPASVSRPGIAVVPATPKPAPAAVPVAPVADDAVPKSLVLSDTKGLKIEFRVLIPPNLAVTAADDSIMVKLEAIMPDGKPAAPEFLDRGRAYRMSPEDARLAALVETWCGGKLHGLMRLTRERLLALLATGAGRPVFAFADKPARALAWTGPVIAGVHEHLRKGAAAPVAGALPATISVSKPVRTPAFGRVEAKPAAPKPVNPFARAMASAGPSAMRVDGNGSWLAISLPSRESALHEPAKELLKSAGFLNDATARVWRLTDRHKALTFLAGALDRLRGEFGAEFTPAFEAAAAKFSVARAVCAAEADGDGFELELRIEAEGADDAAVQRALVQNRPYVESADGRCVLIPPAVVAGVTEARRRISGDAEARHGGPVFRKKLSAPELAGAESALEELSAGFEPPEAWKKRAGALRNLSRLEAAPCLPALGERLRLYQQIGAAWLWHLHKSGLAGVLADEMGLGKTVQAIAYLDAVLRRAGAGARTLVVCPAALLENWFREADRFAPGRPVLKHHGARRGDHAEVFSGYDIVVTSYATLTRDIELFNETEWTAVIADEAQHIKNRRSQNAQALRSLRAKGRAVLTGTPVENSLDDLRSIFDFLMPGYLPRPPAGLSRDDRVWHDNQLRERCAPYILRRTKKTVAPELPDKIHQTVFCEPEPKQAALYAKWLERTRSEIFELEMGGASESRVRHAAFQQLLRLRQICADPRLVDDTADEGDSAKLKALREILDEAADGDHRVLVFSQFVGALTHIRAALERDGTPYCYIDGSTRDRQREVDRFNGDASIPVFLISLKAGGVGLNLTGADTVVHFDPWWNPAAEAQATDRAHRIGQSRTVTSIKLLVSGTVEERVTAIQETKAKLLADLLEAGDEANASVSIADIKEMIGLRQKAE